MDCKCLILHFKSKVLLIEIQIRQQLIILKNTKNIKIKQNNQINKLYKTINLILQ